MYVICTLVGERSKNVVHELVGEQKKRGQLKETYEEPLVSGACGGQMSVKRQSISISSCISTNRLRRSQSTLSDSCKGVEHRTHGTPVIVGAIVNSVGFP